MTLSIHPTVRLSKHQKLTGIWNKETYVIARQIGEGARGSIYLAYNQNRYVALKISQDSSVISAEVNVLKTLKKAQGYPLGPLLLDVDDAKVNQHDKYAFYVMEYIDGIPLKKWIDQKGLNWLNRLSIQLLSQLHQLHQLGYIFGDLKPDNILVEKRTKRARLVDVGGVTQIGRSIREYTTWYDRGYWKMGDRRAEPKYDLFAYAVCMLNMDPNSMVQKSNHKDIMRILHQSVQLKPYHGVIRQALHGKYRSAQEMRQALIQLNNQLKKKSKRIQRQPKHNQDNHLAEILGMSSIISIHMLLFYYFIF
ncbi:serine/threonine protein kinase [Tenuibacillus multivorans]|uniref:Serine/threonine protein kinase n=1 Tax=Tenuibacillus multivorans TaxID=237069 RepID=A0A1G9VZ05_9BACI|nr:protein kinase [Tenuibacillus multivorans]GEL78244.1 putative serine/threonine-protein kinase YabT [Tenuibacillus multivorans]SDM77156.1 serine/threonine protein kinase [Tenuibacillus multivorans]